MEAFYWILQYLHVLIAYIFIMFIWPSVVFRKHLKTKSRSYRFAFCWVVMIAIIDLFCIGLGLVHLLNPWLYRLVFYGTFIYSLVKGKKIDPETIKRFKYFIGGTYGTKSMFSDLFKYIRKKIKDVWKVFLEFMKGHWIEYIVLFIVFTFGLVYFAYSPLHDLSPGCGDVYVHCMWTYHITDGTIFSHGIYPEGMHFFMGSECLLFGVPLWNSVIFTGSINVIGMMGAMYIFFKEFFRWKHSALIGVLLFLTLNGCGGNQIFTLARIQWGMPMEFGYPGMFICAAYLIRFLRFSVVKKKTKEEKKAERKQIRIPFIKKTISISIPLCFKDENLFLFMMGMASTITIHFYTTFFAFFLCLGIAFVLIYKIFSRKFVPLAISVIVGLMVSGLPMAVCFVSGIPLQGSLRWGLAVMGIHLNDNQAATTETQDTETQEENGDSQGSSDNASGNGQDDAGSTGETNSEKTDAQSVATTTYNENMNLGVVATSTVITNENAISGGLGIIQHIENFLGMLKKGFTGSGHERNRGLTYFYITVISFFLSLALNIVRTIYYKVKKKTAGPSPFLGYMLFAGATSVIHLYVRCEQMGIPYMIEVYRIFCMTFMMGLPALVIPVDFVMGFVEHWIPKAVKDSIGAGLVIATYVLVRATGNFHGFLFYELSRYNSTVMVTKQIVNSLPDESYTIVSSTDELYQIMGRGYHEELVHFINESQLVSYTIPTEYIFIFVEKNAISRGQYHFPEGPEWLASNTKYYNVFDGSGVESIGDNIRKETINEDMANIFFGKFREKISVYALLWQRVVLNSKIYVWCQRFNAMYPNEMHIYYEDDDLICFYLHQNQRNLYELAAMDPTVMVSPEEYANPIWPENYEKNMESITLEDIDDIKEPDEAEEDTETSDTNK